MERQELAKYAVIALKKEMEGDILRDVHVIVNAKTGVPIKSPGLCSGYRRSEDANKACEIWNKLAATYGKDPAVVRRVGNEDY